MVNTRKASFPEVCTERARTASVIGWTSKRIRHSTKPDRASKADGRTRPRSQPDAVGEFRNRFSVADDVDPKPVRAGICAAGGISPFGWSSQIHQAAVSGAGQDP